MKHFASLIAAALVAGMAVPVSADTWTLEFDSLPSVQGWSYAGNVLAESDAYSVDGTSLLQTAVGSGSNAFPRYSLSGVVSFDKPMVLEFTARVLAHENLSGGGGSSGRGFNVEIIADDHAFWIGLEDDSVSVNDVDIVFDTTEFHNYRLEIRAPGDAQLYIDNYPRQGARSYTPNFFNNRITFGDTTEHENTDVEITAFSFEVQDNTDADILVEKTVDNTFPGPGEPVEFTILASNIGTEDATGVVVIDRLPDEMEIPAGMAASTDVGTYDPASGEWMIGSLPVGVTRSLVLPAVVTAQNPPDCVVNTARSSVIDVPGDGNDSASAAVHQNGAERCVDLGVSFSISSGPIFPSCDQTGTYSGDVEVTNLGSVPARNVSVTMNLAPTIGPNVRFSDPDCNNAPSMVCNIGEIAPGETVTLDVTSDEYRSYELFTQEISVSATTTDADYDLSNNNPTVTGTGRAFSSCEEPDFGFSDLEIGPAGCFIATAAYGTPLDARLGALRAFRDQHLLTNAPGRAFVAFYYQYSPPIADFIAERDWLRAIVRGVLAPVVFAIEEPFITTAGSFCVIVLVAVVIRRRRSSREAITAES